MKQLLFFISGIAMAMVGTGCGSGCVTCSGISADQEICKGDFQEKSDYNAYVNAYEEQGGICE